MGTGNLLLGTAIGMDYSCNIPSRGRNLLPLGALVQRDFKIPIHHTTHPLSVTLLFFNSFRFQFHNSSSSMHSVFHSVSHVFFSHPPTCYYLGEVAERFTSLSCS